MNSSRLFHWTASLVLASLCLGGSIEAASKKLLVVTVTKGFRHSSIPTAESVLGALAAGSSHFEVDYARTDEEIAEAGDDEETVDAALAGRRAAAIRLVHETAVYHGVASINGTNKDVGGHETVALVSVARPAPRCSPGAVEAPRVLFAVATNKSTPGFFGHDGQIYERVGVYAVLGPGPANGLAVGLRGAVQAPRKAPPAAPRHAHVRSERAC